MKDYHALQFSDDRYYKKKSKRAKVTSDTIYTFDIEVTSLFKINNKWQPFDYDLSQDEYSGIEKAGVPYIWMFGVNGEVYYGREFYEFKRVLLKISDKCMHKVIWVHNLSYEFQFLRDIFEGYTIENVVCRDALKPISFSIKELNIEFRCSYMLTNMSLDRASKEYGRVYKKTGTFDYNKSRGTTTPLTKKELLYCEYDIKSLNSIIKYFLNKYEHIANIPLTATGEVRKDLRDKLDYWYYVNNPWKLVPEKDIYLKLMATFAGGYTHANMIHSNRVVYNITSYDIASSYPAILVTEKFPAGPFKQYNYERYKQLSKRDTYAWLFEIRIKNLKSKYYNHYISFSKIYDYDIKSLTTDNGRVVRCDSFSMWVTDVDLDLISQNYDCEIEYLQIYGSFKKYLDIRIIKYVLEQYKNKTALKGIPEKTALYKKSKAYINSIYGMTVTNPLKNSTTFDMIEGWSKIDYNDPVKFNEFVDDVLEKQKHSYSNLMFYAVGLWVCAIGRRNVYSTLLKIDNDVVYCDTDSIKYTHVHDDIFEEYNKNMLIKYKAVIKHYPELAMNDFMPEDREGNKRPIGFFEYDGFYTEFKTLGAKKYAYIEDDELHITVSGVAKSGVAALNDDINNFKKGFTWGYKESGKLTHIYNDDQKAFIFYDHKGKRQESRQQHGVVLQPTTYTLGITSEYEALINEEYDRRLRK